MSQESMLPTETENRLLKDSLIEKGLIRTRTNAVYDFDFVLALREVPWGEWMQKNNPLRCREDYLEKIHHWIMSSELNSISGLEAYPVRHLINGTTQSFDEFYYKYVGKRLRVFRGEYAYHRRVFSNWCFLEDAPLAKGDVIIISAPFCTTGNVHPQTLEVLDQAERLGCPVLLDCAYFGTCHSLEINVDHPAIESVSFSLTKGLGLGDIRSGVRYSRSTDTLPINQQNDYDHTILAAAKFGIYMMEKFSPDFIPGKYRQMQEQLCREVGVTATPCMHLALGDSGWPEFEVDDRYYRLGIRELIKARRKGLI